MHRPSLARCRPLQLAAPIAVAVFMLLAVPGRAQTPETGTPALGASSHPAHIHAGSCDELGDVVVPLTNVEFAPDAILEGSDAAHVVEVSQTNVDMPLQAIIDGDHAVNVHLSDEEIDTYIACGDVGGAVVVDPSGATELFFGLREMNDSGYTGVVRLGIGDDPNQTEVSVMVIEPDKMS